MSKEDTELLFKELCLRLPYKTMVNYERRKVQLTPYILWESIATSLPKPYLRPLYTISGAECINFRETTGFRIFKTVKKDNITGKEIQIAGITNNHDGIVSMVDIYDMYSAIEWLNKHHFDYCNLINKGLALKATKNTY